MSTPAIQNLQQFTDGLYLNIVKHLPRVVTRSKELLNEAAVVYARSGQPEDRAVFQGLEGRVDAIKGLVTAILSDPLISPNVVAEIHATFPEFSTDTIADTAAQLTNTAVFATGVAIAEPTTEPAAAAAAAAQPPK